MNYVTATTLAATVGKYVAIALGIYALWNFNLMLMLLAGFVMFAGQREKWAVMMRHGHGPSGNPRERANPFGNGPVFESEKPARDEVNVPASLSTDSVIAWLRNVRAECCNVVESGRIVGQLTKAQLLGMLSRGLGSMPIGQAMTKK